MLCYVQIQCECLTIIVCEEVKNQICYAMKHINHMQTKHTHTSYTHTPMLVIVIHVIDKCHSYTKKWKKMCEIPLYCTIIVLLIILFNR